MNITPHLHRLAVSALAALACITAHAQTGQPREDIRLAVERALVPLLGQDARAMVQRLAQVRPEGAISQNFNLQQAVTVLFPRVSVVAAPDCRVLNTATGEPDTSRCTYSAGRLDDPGGGAYTGLSFSKNIAQGDVRFVRRPAFLVGGSAVPPPVRLSDADAYTRALQFATLLGVPASEIPTPPTLQSVRLPVRTLTAGAGDGSVNQVRIPLQKVVSLQRAFRVPGGLYVDPLTGVRVDHVLAPGNATLVMDDTGLQFARIDGWADAQFDPQVNASRAKTVTALSAEIAEDLYNEGVRQPGQVSVMVALRRAQTHPEDPNPPPCAVCGVLRPALRVTVSQVGSEPVPTNARSFVAPGVVREYDLVAFDETTRPAR